MAPTYAITGIQTGVYQPDIYDTAVPLRLEVDSWYPGQTAEHLIQNSLFLHALRCLQQRDPDHKLSFFQIAGIHGLPYQPWDEDKDAVTPNEGYCTHDSLLFPCWHRPFMLLYEASLPLSPLFTQVLHEIMVKQVIPQLPKAEQQKWTTASDTWRLPYWDWAQKKSRAGKNDPIYDVPLIAQEPRIGVLDLNDGVTEVYIDNPMYKFTMPNNEKPGGFGISDIQDTDPNDKIMTIPFSKSVGTSRWATYEPESGNVSTAWVEGTVRNEKISNALNSHPWYGKGVDQVPLAEMVYRLYLHDYITSFTQFATTKFKTSTEYDPDAPAAYLNLEYVHNNIHNWTGGTDVGYIGHMAEPVVAGYDPIFWMHHANVDRQFALWQTINSKESDKNWFQDPSEQLQDDGTWSIKPGDTDTPSTPLTPFHKDTVGTYFTSDDIRDWTKWGYSYPELQPWLSKYKSLPHDQFNVDLYIADVKNQLKALYSPFEEEQESKVPRSLGIEHWTKDIIINVTYDRFAFNGTPYTIYFFIGSPSSLENYKGAWQQHPQHVGFVYTFSNPIYRNRAAPGCGNCRRKALEGTRSRAQVPITGALLARMHAHSTLEENSAGTEWGAAVLGGLPHGIQRLPSLEIDTVGVYLEKHLHWRVRTVCTT
ncbi:common central domain of tyrosinase-domain-containing protein [Podospora australis]|uniref:tyrosinase n=1 Tax=Podospora australis TaxID=1536484 RepID=A0AAN6WP52_9PEZI|nr:common central domain of tyrosinase-domain-containing protein [Podospora australis]